MGKSSPSAPAAPDPVATAEAQAAANKEAAITTARLNRINQYTPYGATKFRNIGPTPEQVASSYEVGGRSFATMDDAMAYASTLQAPELDRGYVYRGEDILPTFSVDGRYFDTEDAARSYMLSQTPESRITQVGGGWSVDGQTFATKEEADKAAQELEQWEQYVELSPEGQQIFDTQQQITSGLSDLALARMGMISPDAMSFEGIPEIAASPEERQRIEQATYERAASLFEPQMEQQREGLHTQLIQQGIPIGSEAYKTAMGEFDRGLNEMRQQAAYQSVAAGGAEYQNEFARNQALRQQAINEMMMERSQPFNELSAFLQGAPVMNTPQLQSASPVNVAAPDVMGATYNSYAAQMNAYNQQLQQQAQQQGALGSLAGTLGMGLMAFNPFGWGAAAGAGLAGGPAMLGR